MCAGRPRQFDRNDALERAMELFWSRGYAGAGVAELLDEMGISRQSLYDTFGNKRALFFSVIDHYRTTRLSEALQLLERDEPPLENVKAVLRFFEELAADSRCRGCLVANALVELAPHDEELSEMLQGTLDLLQAGIRQALEQARDRGELAPDKSPAALSRAMMNSMIGLAVTGKLRHGRRALREIYDGTLAMLA